MHNIVYYSCLHNYLLSGLKYHSLAMLRGEKNLCFN